MRQFLFLWIVILAYPSFGHSQDSDATPVVPKAKLQDSDTTQSILTALEEARKKAEADYNNLILDLEEDAVSRLKEIGKQRAAAGEIADAKEAWTELLKLAPANPEGKAFCEAMGIWDQVRKQVAKFNKSSRRTSAMLEYRCESGRTFKKQRNGLWSDSDFPVQYKEVERTEYSVTITALSPTAEVTLLLPDHYLWQMQKNWDKGQRSRGENGGWIR